ncbi:hypothetical protein [Thermasporomyces composti]|jgi:hypothetical protein|uniref:Uncharacterized protein n=1 Tax=Thermasporomyces composti TaxID=696763 RepID=A0A3D9VDR3_THECX|nr:hypothetical protein [Thermasporomyces composti]REF38290.1 hypothetical protein DFJ64_3765 [Thermasporomyces composti]
MPRAEYRERKRDTASSARSTPTVSRTPPKKRAEQRLLEALGQLAADGGIHYKGSPRIGPTPWTKVDLRVTSSGAAYGSMARVTQKAQVFALGAETVFVRGNTPFWMSALGNLTSGPDDVARKAELFAQHWALVHPEVVSRVGEVLRPAALADELRRFVSEDGVRSVRSGTVNGEAVDVITVGDSVFHVTKAEPARLLRMRVPRLPAYGEAGSSGLVGGIAGSSHGHGEARVAACYCRTCRATRTSTSSSVGIPTS